MGKSLSFQENVYNTYKIIKSKKNKQLFLEKCFVFAWEGIEIKANYEVDLAFSGVKPSIKLKNNGGGNNNPNGNNQYKNKKNNEEIFKNCFNLEPENEKNSQFFLKNEIKNNKKCSEIDLNIETKSNEINNEFGHTDQNENGHFFINNKYINNKDNKYISDKYINNKNILRSDYYNKFNLTFIDDKLKDTYFKWLTYKKEEHNFCFKSQLTLEANYKLFLGYTGGDPTKAEEYIDLHIAKGWKGFVDPRDLEKNNSALCSVKKQLNPFDTNGRLLMDIPEMPTDRPLTVEEQLLYY